MNAAELNKNLTPGHWGAFYPSQVLGRTDQLVMASAFSRHTIVAQVHGTEADLQLMAAAPDIANALRMVVEHSVRSGLMDTDIGPIVRIAMQALHNAGLAYSPPGPPPPLTEAAFWTVERILTTVRADSFGRAYVRTFAEAQAASRRIYEAWPHKPFGTDVSIGPDRNGYYVDFKVRSCE